MKDVLSPKELAAAIGVSESSLRRWVDAGLLKFSKTAGGHRRIPLAEAVRFIRESHASVVRPELLGFAPLTTAPAEPKNLSAERERLYEALLAGDTAMSRGIVMSLYLTGSSLTQLFDEVIAPCMHRVGELWQHSPKGIMLEHRATDLVLQVVAQLRQTLPPAPSGAPKAVGGAPSEDVYLLPAQMAAAVLSDVGYAVQNLGPETPFDTFALAASELCPSIVYVSVTSTIAAERIGADDLGKLAGRLATCGTTLVAGGQQLPRIRPEGHPNLHLLGNMGELAAFGRGALGKFTKPADAPRGQPN